MAQSESLDFQRREQPRKLHPHRGFVIFGGDHSNHIREQKQQSRTVKRQTSRDLVQDSNCAALPSKRSVVLPVIVPLISSVVPTDRMRPIKFLLKTNVKIHLPPTRSMVPFTCCAALAASISPSPSSLMVAPLPSNSAEPSTWPIFSYYKKWTQSVFDPRRPLRQLPRPDQHNS